MPWLIRKREGEYCVYKEGADGEPTGDSLGCHATESEAEAQRRALYVHADGKATSREDASWANLLVYVGDAVKALDDGGRVGGYLVRYGTPEDVDLTGDYFDASTDFDVDDWPHKSRVYYQHGLDKRLKHRKLGSGEMRQDEIGVWVEAQLALRDEYEKAIFELVKQGKMGWSSGTAGHLVEREQKGTANHIKHWPLGLDASITPTPAEYRNSALSLKSLAAVDSSFSALLPEDTRPVSVQSEEAGETAAVAWENSKGPSPLAVSHLVIKNNSQEAIMPENEEVTAVDEESSPDELKVSTLVDTKIDTALQDIRSWIEKQPINEAGIQVPMVNSKTKLGDSETKSFAHWVRTGDSGGIQHLKASNNVPLLEGVGAQGGFAVPTGHHREIIAKLREDALYPKIGVRNIPGQGLTVNVPVEGARDGAFIEIAEGLTTDRDAPILAQVPITLRKFTKRIELTWELMTDEDSQLMSFLSTWVGEGMAKTHNQLLVTEALANGTAAAAWTGGATPITPEDIPELVYLLPTGYEDGAVWIMRKTVEGAIRAKTGSNFQFVPTAPDGDTALSRRELWGFPLYNSEAMPALGASAKVALFGNFRYMGMRLMPDITFLRDPYSAAVTGQLRLHYYFRVCYKILQAEAVLYATQGT